MIHLSYLYELIANLMEYLHTAKPEQNCDNLLPLFGILPVRLKGNIIIMDINYKQSTNEPFLVN